MNLKFYTFTVSVTATLTLMGLMNPTEERVIARIPIDTQLPEATDGVAYRPEVIEPFSYRDEVMEIEPDLISPMVTNTAIQQEDAELALEVAKTYEDYQEVFLLQMTVMKIESDFVHLDMNQSGDVGIMQLNNATWEGHRKVNGADWSPYNKYDNIVGGTQEILRCAEQARERHPEDWKRWAYIYYNRGKSVEVSQRWQDQSFRETSYVRADKFEHYLNLYANYLELF